MQAAALSPPTLDAVVIGWNGYAERCRHIARQLDGLPGVRVRVIHSNATQTPETGAGAWHLVPDDHFFGAKFAAALPEFDRDILLVIQADALSTDWPAVVQRCQRRFAQESRLGMWAPRVDYTPWLPGRVDIPQATAAGLTAVAHTDGIVLALSRQVVQRLQALDYSRNNIGWGIDWIAICHCYSSGLAVMREDDLAIAHPPSRGYDTRQATAQWLAFMRQMSPAEHAMFEILKRYTAEPRRGLWGKLRLKLAKRRAARRAQEVARRSVPA